MSLEKPLLPWHRITGCFVVASTIAALAFAEPEKTSPPLPENLPEAYQQLIPRGAIPSVDEPRFVTAAEAELPDDAWILGVEIDGQARAYSLNLLNHHEVVNDAVGDVAYAAVW